MKTLLDTPPKNLKPRSLPTTPSARGFGLLQSLAMTNRGNNTFLCWSLRGGRSPTKQSPLWLLPFGESIERGIFTRSSMKTSPIPHPKGVKAKIALFFHLPLPNMYYINSCYNCLYAKQKIVFYSWFWCYLRRFFFDSYTANRRISYCSCNLSTHS